MAGPFKMKGYSYPGTSPVKHFTGFKHPETDPAHKTPPITPSDTIKTPPITPSDTTITKKPTIPFEIGTLNAEKTKRWDGKKWVIIKKTTT